MKYLYIALLSISVCYLQAAKRKHSQSIESKRIKLERLKGLRLKPHRALKIAKLFQTINYYEELQHLQAALRDFERHFEQYDTSSDNDSASNSSHEALRSDDEWRNGYGPEIYKASYPASDSESSNSSDDEVYFMSQEDIPDYALGDNPGYCSEDERYL
jgi:hypothetical protein